MTNRPYSPTEFQATMDKHIQFYTEKAVQLGEPVDMSQETYEAFLKNIKYQSQQEHSDCTFYLVFNQKTFELDWLHQIDKSLGVPNDLSSIEFFRLIHPDYFKMYMLWAFCSTELALELSPRVRPLSHTYHIPLPLRRKDGTYHWFHQQSRPLRVDAKGQMCSFINTYQYGGEWTDYTLRPFIPHITFDHAPTTNLTARLTLHFCKFIQQFFTPIEIKIIKLYATGLSVDKTADVMGKKRYTLLDYNKSILGKANSLLCYQFGTAHRAAQYLTEKKLLDF